MAIFIEGESGKMLNRNSVSRTVICVILLLAVVFFVAGCKKSAPQPAPEPPEPAPPNAGGKTGMVPIPLELPKPMFVGTPTNIEGVTNLE